MHDSIKILFLISERNESYPLELMEISFYQVLQSLFGIIPLQSNSKLSGINKLIKILSIFPSFLNL